MAVKKGAELNFSNKKFMVIISGQPGLGKTTLALSAPKPFLFDIDLGIARVNRKHYGDDVPISTVDTYKEMLADIVSDEYKNAESIVIDTGGSLVQLMKDWARETDSKAAKDGRAMYGVIKTEFDRLCYQIRNKDKKNLVVVFHTTEQQKGDTIQTRLSCEGGTKDIVWTPADFGGHMTMLGSKRMIGFSPTEEYFAKGCFGVSGLISVPELADGQKNDFLTKLFEKAQKNIDAEAKTYSADKQKYDEAIRLGLDIIGTVEDLETANSALINIAEIDHALTSKAELFAKLKARCSELGLKYSKSVGGFTIT